ncbi:MAG: hypothetical protein PVI77_20250, partial [Desulfobacterales bacterium]
STISASFRNEFVSLELYYLYIGWLDGELKCYWDIIRFKKAFLEIFWTVVLFKLDADGRVAFDGN